MDSDEFYSERGVNNFCQNLDPSEILYQADKEVCTQNKFSKIVILYMDSLPMDLFKFQNKFIYKNSLLLPIEHLGINDSGPILTTFSTGKLSNNYDTKMNRLDNIFKQMQLSGMQIEAVGYNYPIYELVGTKYFSKYKNRKNFFTKELSKKFINIQKIRSKNIKMKESLIFDFNDYFSQFNKFYQMYKIKLQKHKETLNKSLDNYFSKNISHFMYEVYTDSIGHQLSRQSNIYVNKIAGLRANLDFLISYFNNSKKDTVLIILSDHGTVGSLWETELSNHGDMKNENQSFIFIQNPLLKQNKFNPLKSIFSTDVPSVFAQLISNFNLPILYEGVNSPILRQVKSRIQALRQKEMQLKTLLNSLKQTQQVKEIIQFQDLNQKKNIQLVKMLLEQKLDYKQFKGQLEMYQIYITQLAIKINQAIQLQKKRSDLKLFVIYFSVIFLFIIFPLFKQSKQIETNRIYYKSNLILFIFLPLIFITLGKVYENIFSIYQLALISVSLMINTYFNKSIELYLQFQKKLYIIIVITLLLMTLRMISEFDKFFFFFYQNSLIQVSLIFMFIVYSLTYMIIFMRANQRQTIIQKLRLVYFICYFFADFIMVIYEFVLLFGDNYFQSKTMRNLSRIFYIIFSVIMILHMNFSKARGLAFFSLGIKIVFWISNNFIRLTYFLIIMPGLFIYSKINKKQHIQEQIRHREYFDFIIQIYMSIFSFNITQNNLDTNVSVRVSNKNWGSSIEELPFFTGLLFMVNKFLPFIIHYFYIQSLMSPKYNLQDNKGIFEQIIGCTQVNLTEVWFGLLIILYMRTLNDQFNQRAGFMLFSIGLVQLIFFYIISLITYFQIIIEKYKNGYRKIQEQKF